MSENYFNDLPVSVTVCDAEGNIVFMNKRAESSFAGSGGSSLKGSNIFGCHNENSAEIIRKLIKNNETNTYTIEKNKVKKLIHQCLWYDSGKVAGLVEFSFEIPEKLPHFIRK